MSTQPETKEKFVVVIISAWEQSLPETVCFRQTVVVEQSKFQSIENACRVCDFSDVIVPKECPMWRLRVHKIKFFRDTTCDEIKEQIGSLPFLPLIPTIDIWERLCSWAQKKTEERERQREIIAKQSKGEMAQYQETPDGWHMLRLDYVLRPKMKREGNEYKISIQDITTWIDTLAKSQFASTMEHAREVKEFIKTWKAGMLIENDDYICNGLYYIGDDQCLHTTLEDGHCLPSAAFRQVERYGVEYFSECSGGAEFVLIPPGVMVEYHCDGHHNMLVNQLDHKQLAMSLMSQKSKADYVKVNGKVYPRTIKIFSQA